MLAKSIDITTGLNELQTGPFGIYPNPAADYLMVQLPDEFQKATLAIINLQGQQMVENTLELDLHGRQKVFVGNLNNGVYLIRIYSGTRSITSKVIVKH